MKKDKDYGSYVTMQSLVQMVGRACRSEDDWSQSLLIDDNARWFMWKFKHYAPKWFMDAYKVESFIPGVMG